MRRDAGSRRRQRRRNLTAYLYVAPTLLVFVVFALAPFVHAVWLSFFKWDGITIGTWYGFGNYRDAFTDPLIREGFGHAFELVIFFSTIPVGIGLAVAAIMTTVKVRGSTAFRVAIFLPGVVASVVVGRDLELDLRHRRPVQPGPARDRARRPRPTLAGRLRLGPARDRVHRRVVADGHVHGALRRRASSRSPARCTTPSASTAAGRIRELITVTIPGLRYEFGVVLTLTIVTALKTFDLVFVMTRGGPGTETVVPGLLIYNRAFVDGRVGQSCAIAVVLAILVLAVTVAIDRIASKEA